jgi:hypothetical protein
MDVTLATWIVAGLGLALMALLTVAQSIAMLRPRAAWTLENIYGGTPDDTDPRAYFAFNQGMAWADVVFWAPFQIAGSVGMILGARWGLVLALVASVPYWYTAITMFVWDRDLGFRRATVGYWIVWGMWPAFGLLQMTYCAARLM